MKILKHFKKVSILLVMFLFMASSSFAATWYVNNTNGDDLNFDGTSTATPFRTIGAAMTAAADGDEISVAADFYAENVTVTKDLTFVVTTNVSNVLTKATVTGNLIINNNGNNVAPGKTGDVAIGATGLEFEFTGNLTLTDGAVAITSANLRLTNNPILVTVDDGTLDNTPTYVANVVNVTYITGASRSNTAELPGDLNGGTLLNNLVAGTLTITKDVVVDMFDNTPGMDAVFNGTLLVEGGTLDNTGGGDVTFKGLATFESDMNNGAGDLVFEAGFVADGADINNGAAGLVDVQANSTFIDGSVALLTDIVNTGVIKLDVNTLTVEGATRAININNTGDIISVTASTVGDGILELIGDQVIGIAGAGELPNVSIPNTLVTGGSVVLGANIDVYGDLTLDAGIANALVDGGNDINMYGDFLRTNDTNIGSFNATGLLAFLGAVDQTFDPGASLQIQDLTIDNSNKIVTMLASIEIKGDVDITATGNLELDTYNLRMLNVGTTFNNDGTYLSSATTGYVIFESGGANTLQGAGKFSNIDIRDVTQPPVAPFTVVTLGTDVDFSGILRVRDGDLNYAAFNFNITDDLVATPDVFVYLDDGTVTIAGGDMTRTGTTVLYNLTFLESTVRVTSGEWTITSALFLNNLTIGTSVAGVVGVPTVTGPAGPSTIAGTLTVAGTEVLDLNNFAATLIGDGIDHPISGQVQNNELIIKGDASSITGSIVAANLSSIEDWTVDLAAAETFTSTGIRNITGDLTHKDGISDIALANDNVAAPGTTGPTFAGDLLLVDGDLTFAMTALANTIAGGGVIANAGGGGVELVDGTFTLGSDLAAANFTTQTNSTMELGAWDYEANLQFEHDGTGVINASTGFLVLDYAGNFVLTTDLQVANLMIDNVVAQTAGDLEVTNHWVSNSGSYNLNANDVLLSGSTFDFIAGTPGADFTGTGTYLFTGTTATLDADMTMVCDVEFANGSNGMTFVDGTNTNPTWTIDNNFLHTSGDVAMNDVDFIIDGGVAGTFTRVAGAWTSTTAFFILRSNPGVAQGDGWTVDRLAVDDNGVFPPVNNSITADKDFTVNNYLRLAASLDANDPPAQIVGPWNLTLGDGATIERQDDVAKLVEVANSGTTVNLYYTVDTPGGITTSSEADMTNIDELRTEVPLALSRDITVYGELVVDQRVNGAGSGSVDDSPLVPVWDLIMENGSQVRLIDVSGPAAFGTTVLDPVDLIHVYYDNATALPILTSNGELGTAGSPFNTGNVTVDGAAANVDNVQMHRNLTINGTLLINDDADFDLRGLTLTLAGAYTTTDDGEIINALAATTGSVLFGGATNSDITLNNDWVVPVGQPDYTIGINTTTPDVVKTIKGADLDLEHGNPGGVVGPNGSTLQLIKGVLATTSTTNIILRQTDDGAQPVQGFTRTGDSHIDGNIKKYLDATDSRYGTGGVAIALTSVVFPNGTVPSSPSHYRPMELQFTDIPTAGTWITINHTNAKPNGTNGMPLVTNEGFTITNFSNFYWTMTSDINIQTTTNYHVVASAEGYEDQYTQDEVQNIRFVRRKAGNDDNEWVLQGASGYDNSTEDAAVLPAIFPIASKVNVVAKDAEGAIRSEGAIFAYSQANQPPHFTAELADQAIDEGDLLAQTYAIADNDVTNQDLEMFEVTLPPGATFDPLTGEFEWQTDNYSSINSPYTVKIGATDGLDTSYSTAIITVNDVNTGVAWVTNPDAADVAEGVLNTIQYTAETPDTEKTVVYAIVNNGGAATLAIDVATGAVTYTPAAIEVGNVYNIIISADDQAGAGNSVIQQATALTVVETNDPPVIAPATVDTTINEGQALALAFTATDPEVGTLTFSLGAAAPTGATITAGGDFAWTPAYTQAGIDTFNVIVTDDGAPNASDSSLVIIEVLDANSPPIWTGELAADTVFVGDTFSFTYTAEDLDNDELTYTFILPKPGSMTQTKVTNETVKVDWSPVIADTATYLIRQIVTDGIASDTTQTLLTVLVTTVDVSGVVAYNGGAITLDAVTVTLSNGTDTWTDVTAADGAYSFTGIMAGEYTLTAAKTSQWAMPFASDALETQLHVVNPDSTQYLTTALQKVAADVVGVGNITSGDALAILNASVGLKTFEVADWLFDGATITVGTADMVQNLNGIAAGDARDDFDPTGLAKVSSVEVNSDEILNIKKESEFELPISISELSEIGSFTFKLKYDVEKVEFVGVSTENGGTLVANVVEDVISIAWVNLGSKEINVKDGDALATLKFKATALFAKTDEVSLELLDGAEITDRMAKNLSAGINIPVVAIGIPDVFALRQNYPNPFNPSTTIQYDLPENGKVTLTVYNSLGQRVGTLVNTKQVAGAYEVNFNASNLASGVYLYRVTVEGSKNFVMTKKMILMK